MGLDEPTESELIRDLFQITEQIAADVAEIKADRQNYVTRETQDLRVGALEKRVETLENKRQQWWTLLALPVMVGVLVPVVQELIK